MIACKTDKGFYIPIKGSACEAYDVSTGCICSYPKKFELLDIDVVDGSFMYDGELAVSARNEPVLLLLPSGIRIPKAIGWVYLEVNTFDYFMTPDGDIYLQLPEMAIDILTLEEILFDADTPVSAIGRPSTVNSPAWWRGFYAFDIPEGEIRLS